MHWGNFSLWSKGKIKKIDSLTILNCVQPIHQVKVKYLCLPNKPCGEKKRMRMPDRRMHLRETVGIVDSNVSARESEETEESMLKYDDRSSDIISKQIFLHLSYGEY